MRAEPAHRNSDWHRYTPDVCRPAIIVCDGIHPEELPPEFTYGEDLETSETVTIIVVSDEQRSSDSRTQSGDGDGRYLLRTGDTSHADGFVDIDGIASLVTLLPLGLFIAVVAGAPTPSRREHQLAVLVASGGIGLVVVSFVSTSIQLTLLGMVGVILGGPVGVPSSKRTLTGLILIGVIVAALGVLAPYIVMFTSISVGDIAVPLLGAIWLGFAIAAGYTIYTRATRTEE